jgi:hypothetical protein
MGRCVRLGRSHQCVPRIPGVRIIRTRRRSANVDNIVEQQQQQQQQQLGHHQRRSKSATSPSTSVAAVPSSTVLSPSEIEADQAVAVALAIATSVPPAK